jgi:protein-disulfide isomerase
MSARISHWHILSSIRFNCLFADACGSFSVISTEVHPHAEIAAESAEFAGASGLFWDMYDALFENQSRLSITTIFLIGAELGLAEAATRHALETGQYRNKVRGDFIDGVRSGLNGTPTFFINGVRHDGAYDYASLVAGIQMRFAADTIT